MHLFKSVSTPDEGGGFIFIFLILYLPQILLFKNPFPFSSLKFYFSKLLPLPLYHLSLAFLSLSPHISIFHLHSVRCLSIPLCLTFPLCSTIPLPPSSPTSISAISAISARSVIISISAVCDVKRSADSQKFHTSLPALAGV